MKYKKYDVGGEIQKRKINPNVDLNMNWDLVDPNKSYNFIEMMHRKFGDFEQSIPLEKTKNWEDIEPTLDKSLEDFMINAGIEKGSEEASLLKFLHGGVSDKMYIEEHDDPTEAYKKGFYQVSPFGKPDTVRVGKGDVEGLVNFISESREDTQEVQDKLKLFKRKWNELDNTKKYEDGYRIEKRKISPEWREPHAYEAATSEKTDINAYLMDMLERPEKYGDIYQSISIADMPGYDEIEPSLDESFEEFMKSANIEKGSEKYALMEMLYKLGDKKYIKQYDSPAKAFKEGLLGYTTGDKYHQPDTVHVGTGDVDDYSKFIGLSRSDDEDIQNQLKFIQRKIGEEKSYDEGGEISEFTDERGKIVQILDYIMKNVSPSEYEGAYKDLDKLIENADAEAEYAKLFGGKDKFDRPYEYAYYRHLNPQDSTVSIVGSIADILYARDDIDDILLRGAKKNVKKGDTVSHQEAARSLAALRNK